MSTMGGAVCAAAVAIAAVILHATGAPAAVPGAEDASAVTVVLDKSEVTAGPGERLSFTSTVTNTGGQELSGLIAHLNILTTDPDVYVDPEDWSPRRTQYLDNLPPGELTRLTWNVQAVTSGPLVLFVSVTGGGTDRVESSRPLRLTVQGQRVVDSARVLPIVMWTPAGLLVLLGATGLRRRRHR